MDCDICSRGFGQNRAPICPSCARTGIYESRINQVTSLLDKERLHQRVQTLISPPSDISSLSLDGPELVEVTESAKKLAVDRQRNQIEVIEQKLQDIKEQQELLRLQIEQAREENAGRKSAHKQRHLDIAGELQELDTRKPLLVEPLKAEIKRLNHKLGKVHMRTIEGREKLCEATVRLAGLRQRRRKTSDGNSKDSYAIGTTAITDLRDLNTAHPEYVTASLANICRLLTTCCHYLSVRLPAEIILPHANYPHPVIMSLQSSYQSLDVSLAGTAPSSSVFPSPASSRTLPGRPKAKIRLLYLDRPLPRLAKEDPSAYNLFIEGVVLLAWNVAWLCRSQGVTTVDSWEDVCSMGRNLCQLFPGDRSDDVSKARRVSQPISGAASPASEPIVPRFGQFSHASSYDNLAGPKGTELMRTWHVPSLARIIDKIKSHLLNDMSGAEWELLDEREWNEERDDEQAVLVGGTRPEQGSRIGMSVMTALEDRESRKGNSGWTKLKSRGSEGT